jgi:hypothetical protein
MRNQEYRTEDTLEETFNKLKNEISSLESKTNLKLESTKGQLLDSIRPSIESLINQKLAQFSQQQNIDSLKNSITSVENKIESRIDNLRNQITESIMSSVESLIDQKLSQASQNQAFQEKEPSEEQSFNYEIPEPDGNDDFKSAIAMEINFNSTTLHVLGLQNKELKWIATEDCD